MSDYMQKMWDEAEVGVPREGDTIIGRFPSDNLFVIVAACDYERANEDTRIVERALQPEPKPRAVMARSMDEDSTREVYTERMDGRWESYYYIVEADDLVDPVEMVEMPDYPELTNALIRVPSEHGTGWEWPGATPLADAVIELLKGDSK